MHVYNITNQSVYSYNEKRIRTELEEDNILFRLNNVNGTIYVNPLRIQGNDIRYTLLANSDNESYRQATVRLLSEARAIWTSATQPDTTSPAPSPEPAEPAEPTLDIDDFCYAVYLDSGSDC